MIKSITIENAKIKSVEKGSIHTNPTSPVIAFTVVKELGDSSSIKIIVKDNMAKFVWGLIGEGQTIDRTVAFDNIVSSIEAIVNLEAEFREIRVSELVLHKMKKFEVIFKHVIEDKA